MVNSNPWSTSKPVIEYGCLNPACDKTRGLVDRNDSAYGKIPARCTCGAEVRKAFGYYYVAVPSAFGKSNLPRRMNEPMEVHSRHSLLKAANKAHRQAGPRFIVKFQAG